MALIVICSILIVFAFIGGVSICLCRRNGPENPANNSVVNGHGNQVPRKITIIIVCPKNII